jgi:peptide/nickel transport system permease protein
MGSNKRLETIGRVAKYTGFRAIALFLTVVVGVYLTIIIANMGGRVDQIRIAQIQESVGARVAADPKLQMLPASEIRNYIDAQVELQKKSLGLDRPFMVRSFSYLKDALSLSLGRAEVLTSDSGSKQVREILVERLPATLLLFAISDLIIFFVGIFGALWLSRRYGSFFDKLVIALAPTSAAPSWFYGIFLILIFAALFKILPFGGIVAAPPPQGALSYAWSVLLHLILPVAAILIGSIFITIYSWRTFFLIYSAEDYVEMAKARGLSSGTIERRYILRPTMPTLITSFSLGIIGIWMGSIILEVVFNWPGIGRLLYQAINAFDTPVIVASVVIYAYLLAVTVFLLDIVYALVDPRVKVGAGGRP